MRLRLAAFEQLVAQHSAILLRQLVDPAVGRRLIDQLGLACGIPASACGCSVCRTGLRGCGGVLLPGLPTLSLLRVLRVILLMASGILVRSSLILIAALSCVLIGLSLLSRLLSLILLPRLSILRVSALLPLLRLILLVPIILVIVRRLLVLGGGRGSDGHGDLLLGCRLPAIGDRDGDLGAARHRACSTQRAVAIQTQALGQDAIGDAPMEGGRAAGDRLGSL